MTKSNYNFKRHLTLLSKRKQFLEDDQKLSEKEAGELLKYGCIIEEDILWKNRFYLYESMKDFLNYDIDGEKLCGRVFGLRRNLLESKQKFEAELMMGKITDFQPEANAYMIKGFLSEFFSNCDFFMGEYENSEFYTSIQTGFENLKQIVYIDTQLEPE